MTERVRIRRALLSVSDKQGLVAFARLLAAREVEIVSTGGTAKALREAGLSVTDVAAITGAKEMLGGRVKSLHPLVHGGILYRRGNEDDEAAIAAFGIPAIDLVVVNLYPFERTIEDRGVDLETAIEMIDVGGPAMIRAAAKNWPGVVVVTRPEQYERVGAEIEAGGVTATTRLGLALEAFARTSAYDAAIAGFLAQRIGAEKASSGETDGVWSPVFVQAGRLRQPLRYGENPHQRGAFYVPESPGAAGVAGLTRMQGKELSYNNLLDLDAGWRLAQALGSPAAVVVKHRNPCGAARGDTLAAAFRDAWASDPLSAFGGVVVLRGTVDEPLAEELVEPFVEVIAAASFAPGARARLAAKKNLVLLEGAGLDRAGEPLARDLVEVRSVVGGWLAQDADQPEGAGEVEPHTVTERAPTEAEWKALLFAWQVVRVVQSNAIVLARGQRTIGVGCGQTSRIDAVESALGKAARGGHEARGSVMASDAFFPFADGVEAAAKAGCTAVIQPGGSRRDAESIEAANKAGMAMVFTERRCFRH